MKASQATYLVQNFPQFVEVTPQLKYALLTILFNPVFWNIVARLQHKTHFLSKAVGGPYRGCYLLAFIIFTLGIYRDHVYHDALMAQPTYLPLLTSAVVRYSAYAIFAFGNVLVLSSMWALGVTGTYLGDYFGILMKERVVSFPFNINNNPMYNGSTLCFLGTALYYGKPTGILVSAFVYVMYRIALVFEEPYTAKIYSAREKTE